MREPLKRIAFPARQLYNITGRGFCLLIIFTKNLLFYCAERAKNQLIFARGRDDLVMPGGYL